METCMCTARGCTSCRKWLMQIVDASAAHISVSDRHQGSASCGNSTNTVDGICRMHYDIMYTWLSTVKARRYRAAPFCARGMLKIQSYVMIQQRVQEHHLQLRSYKQKSACPPAA